MVGYIFSGIILGVPVFVLITVLVSRNSKKERRNIIRTVESELAYNRAINLMLSSAAFCPVIPVFIWLKNGTTFNDMSLLFFLPVSWLLLFIAIIYLIKSSIKRKSIDNNP